MRLVHLALRIEDWWAGRCSRCGGRGRVYMDAEAIRMRRLLDADDDDITDECPRCRGSGARRGPSFWLRRCPCCNGYGWREVDAAARPIQCKGCAGSGRARRWVR